MIALTLSAIRAEAESLPPRQAVEVLLHYLGELLPDDKSQVGIWPDYAPAGTMRAMLGLLCAREGQAVQHATMIAAIYSGRDEPEDARDTIRVTLSRHRPELALRGMRIEAVRGHGYRMVRDPGVVFPWERA